METLKVPHILCFKIILEKIVSTEWKSRRELLFPFSYCHIYTMQSNNLSLRAMMKIRTQNSVTTEPIMLLEESAAIFLFSGSKYHICKTDTALRHLPHRYIHVPAATINHTIKQTTARSIDFTKHKQRVHSLCSSY